MFFFVKIIIFKNFLLRLLTIQYIFIFSHPTNQVLNFSFVSRSTQSWTSLLSGRLTKTKNTTSLFQIGPLLVT